MDTQIEFLEQSKKVREFIRKHGISRNQLEILLHMGSHDFTPLLEASSDLPASERDRRDLGTLRGNFGYRDSSFSQAICGLSRTGIIQKEINPDNQRRLYLGLTPRGQALYTEARAAIFG